MIQWRFREMYFDSPAVMNATDEATRRVLSKFGAFTRTAIKDLLRVQGRRKTLAEMTEKERRLYFAALRAYERRQRQGRNAAGQFTAIQGGGKKPKRPRTHSRPGQPPFKRSGLLRKFIGFGYDTTTKSVVVGAEPLNGKFVPSALEHGGSTVGSPGTAAAGKRVHIAARPYVEPGYRHEAPKLPAMWKDSIR